MSTSGIALSLVFFPHPFLSKRSVLLPATSVENMDLSGLMNLQRKLLKGTPCALGGGEKGERGHEVKAATPRRT